MTPTTDIDSESHAGKRPGVKAWLLMAPLLAWLLLLVVLPTLTIVIFSFCRRGPLGSVAYDFTLNNYRQLIDWHQTEVVLRAVFAAMIVAAGLWVVRRQFGRSTLVAGVAVFWVALNLNTVTLPVGLMPPFDAYTGPNFTVGLVVVALKAATALVRYGVTPDPTALPWLKIAVVSINYAAASTVICVVLGYPVAYFIAKASPRWRGLLLMSVMVPFWTSFLVRTYAWVTILREGGLFNTLMLKLHIIAEPLNLYPSSTGVMIGLVYTYLPFMILPIYTSIERLDNSLIEAALDLGASPLRAFGRVILPLTKPGIVAGVVLVFVPAVGMFAVNDILGGRKEMLLGNLIERQFIGVSDKPFGSAIGMLLLVLFVVTYAMSQRRRPA